ncbi:MAG TPA: Ig-like domain-containing protein [Myxococcales bacterium]|jgi:hypothetical protein
MRKNRFLIAFLAFAFACSEPPPPAKSCTKTEECGAQQYCSGSLCVSDAEMPSVTIKSPAGGAVLSKETTTLEGSVTDGSGIAKLEYSLDGTNFQQLTVTENFSQAIPLPEIDREERTLTVRATDLAGNAAEASVKVVIDRLGPTLTVTPPEKSTYLATDLGMSVTFSVTASDKSDCTKLEWSIDGANWTQSDDPKSAAVSFPVAVQDDGTRYDFVARATDGLGNSSSSAVVSVLVDAIAPVVEVTSPKQGQLFAPGSPVSVTGKASDTSLDSVSATLDGADLVLAISDGAFSAEIPASPAEARPKLVVTATDKAGNSTVVPVEFVYSAPPTLVIDSPAAGTVFNLASPATIQITGSVTDASSPTLTYLLDGTDTDVPLRADASFSIDFPLGNGDWHDVEIAFTAKDRFGASTPRMLVFTVDRMAPQIVFSAPSPGHTYNLAAASPAKATGTVKDARRASSTWHLDSEQDQHLDLSGDDFSVDLPLSDTEDYKPHSLSITAGDAAGNSTTLPLSYWVDRVRPRVTVDSPATNYACGTSCSPLEAIANIAKPAIHFAGTAEDGGTVDGVSLDFAGAPAKPTGTTSWVYEWNAPVTDHFPITVFVTATDSAGNLSLPVSRSVYVDKISPTVTMAQSDKRLVPLASDLVTFSETMDPDTVAAAATFTPPGPALVSGSGSAFRAQTGSLLPYTVYTLDISTGAKDLAGNPVLAAGNEQFLTETVMPPTGTAIHTPASTPRMAIDADGNPVIAFWDATAGRFFVSSWDGKTWTTNSFLSDPTTTQLRAVYQIEASSPTPAGVDPLVRTVRILYGASTAYGPSLRMTSSKTLLQASWTGFPVVEGTFGSPMNALYGQPSFRMDCGTVTPCSPYTVVSYTTSALTTFSRWFSGNLQVDQKEDYKVTNGKAPYDVRGTGLARPGTATPEIDALAVYTPNGVGVATLDASKGGVTIAGAPRAGGSTPVGSAWLAWSTVGEAILPPLPKCDAALVTVACNSTPESAGSWATSSADRPFGILSPAATALDVAVSPSLVGFAAEDDLKSLVVFGSTTNTCGAAPAPQWDAVLNDAKEPAVAVGPDGRLWKAYVKASTGELMLAQ